MQEIKVSPKFVNTRNVRNFAAMLEALALSAGEGRLAVVYSQAGRGKTRTVQVHAANNRCVFLRCLTIWKKSELGFLRGLCRELGVINPPRSKETVFAAVLEALIAQGGRPVFVEEVEKLPMLHLELVRDLSDLSGAPFVLIGEEELVSHVKNERRMWSRVFQKLEFTPLGVGDIIMYCKEVSGLQLSPEGASLLHAETGGNLRDCKRTLQNLASIMNAKGTQEPTVELIKIAIRQGLQGGA
jgi:hypothetical protein